MSSPEVSEQELLSEFSSILQSKELSHYLQYEKEVKAAFKGQIVDLKKELDPLEGSYVAAEARANGVRVKSRSRILRLWILGVIGILLATAVAVLAIIGDLRNEKVLLPVSDARMATGQRLWLLAAVVTVFVLALMLAWRTQRYLRQTLDATTIAVGEKSRLAAAMRTLVAESIRRSINDVLRSKGIVALATTAPTLVELSSARIVPSATHDYVRDFILGHESSAIGIAGPRGSGKSTLMRAIGGDVQVAMHTVFVSAPVRYDAIDFTRLLLRGAAVQVLDSANVSEEEIEGGRARRVQRTRLIASFVAVNVALLLVLWDYLIGVSPLPRLSALSILGVGIGLYGFATLFYSLTNRLYTPLPGETRPSVRRAATVIRALAWDEERGEKSKNILKFAGGLFGLEDEDSRTMKRRAMSQPDLVLELQTLVTEFAREQPGSRVIFFIDELDKISNRDDLVAVVNGIKDLFHVQGVHFVVSVSTDALASFEQRGLPTRDAFDSAFDTIISVQRLRLRESIDLISSRVVGFPTVLSMFCHSWSGGLPRDLLRAARRCVEIQRQSPEALTVPQLLSRVVLTDIVAYVDGAVRSCTDETEQNALLGVRETVRKVESGKQTPDVALKILGGQNNAGATHLRLRWMCSLGLVLLEYFSRELNDAQGWDSPSSDVWRVAGAVAEAIEAQGELGAIFEETATAALNLASAKGTSNLTG